jgi:hypothetical protein
MHAKKIVERLLGEYLREQLHAKQAKALEDVVGAALSGAHLSLSRLARGVAPSTAVRHRIKKVDRLLGNAALHARRRALYGEVARRWLAGVTQLLVVVDWSDVTADQRWHLLRASVALEGRSVTLYEEIHPQSKYANYEVHRRFLARIAKLLPAGNRPIVITDAGFRSPWFELVRQRGWQWIGRIRGKDMVQVPEGPWRRCSDMYREASTQAQSFEEARYVRSHPIDCRLVLAKREVKGRRRLGRKGRPCRGHTSLKSARAAREPWLLACSRDLAHLSPEAIIALYGQRMRIEQSFRDLKNERVGLGLSASRSRSGKRLEMLLLVGHLAAWLMRLIGEAAQQCQMHLQFQSVAHLDHREISVMTLARRVIDAGGRWTRRLRTAAALEAINRQARLSSCPQ